MKPYHYVYGTLLAIGAFLAYTVHPWAIAVPFVAIFAVGAHAVFAIKSQVVDHLQCSPDMSKRVALGIIEALLSPDARGTSLPSFISAGRGSHDLRDLYGKPGFQSLCNLVRSVGPVPCYPAYAYLARENNQ